MARRLPVGCAAVVLALFVPAMAAASTFCVGTSGPDCSFGPYAATGDGLQTAIGDADVNADIGGTADTVRIGPGTYLRTGGDGFHTTGGDLSIEGAGQSTVLTTDAASNRIVLRVDGGGTAASVRSLRLDLAGPSNGVFGFKLVSDVRLSGPGSAITGIKLPPGGRLTRATIDPATVYAVAVGGSSAAIEDVVVRLRRSTFSLTQAVALGNDSTAATTNATIRHLTVEGDGGPGTTGVGAEAFGDSSSARTLNVTMRDSVLHNLNVPLNRSAGTSKASNPGTVNIAYRYSSLDLTPGASRASGPGSFTAGPGNLNNPDPLFATDLSLKAASPLIDAGDPAAAEAGDSATDAAGNPRIFGGRRDIGAFEFEPGPGTPGGTGDSGGTAGGGEGTTGGGDATASGGGATAIAARASELDISPTSFRAAPAGPSATAATLTRKRRATGAKVSYTLNVDVSVRFSVRKTQAGRRNGRGKKARCVRATKQNAKARKCTRRVTLRRTFTQSGRAGPDSFHFTGRLGGRKLKPGSYTLVATPTANGKTGRSTSTRFRILR